MRILVSFKGRVYHPTSSAFLNLESIKNLADLKKPASTSISTEQPKTIVKQNLKATKQPQSSWALPNLKEFKPKQDMKIFLLPKETNKEVTF